MNWLHLLASDLWAIVLAQATPTPSPSPSPTAIDPGTVELLKSQVQFLQDANSRITTSFNIFAGLISSVTLVFVGVAAWFFRRTLTEAKQEVDQLVKAEMRKEIAVSIKNRVENLEQILGQEQIIGSIAVDYVLPGANIPFEYQLLLERGFGKTRLRKLGDRLRGDLVVLDLVTPKLSDDEKTAYIEQTADKIPTKSVLIIYIPEQQFPAVKQLSSRNIRYYTAANTAITLIGQVVNSAYVTYTLHKDEGDRD